MRAAPSSVSPITPRCSRAEILGSHAQQHALADRRAGGSTAFGLLAAQLTDRISWGNIAKSLIFMPMAISFVGASVIFKLIYDARPARRPGPDRRAQRRLAGFRRRDLVCAVSQAPSGALARFAALMGSTASICDAASGSQPGKGPWPIALVGSCPARCHRHRLRCG
jgi:hypothetical protein